MPTAVQPPGLFALPTSLEILKLQHLSGWHDHQGNYNLRFRSTCSTAGRVFCKPTGRKTQTHLLPPEWDYWRNCEWKIAGQPTSMTVFLPIWVIFMCVFHCCVNIIITCLPWSSGYIQNKEVKINHVFKNDKNRTDHQKRSIMTNIQLNHLSNKKALKWLTSTSLVYQWVDAFSDSIRSIITVSWSAGGQPVHMQGWRVLLESQGGSLTVGVHICSFILYPSPPEAVAVVCRILAQCKIGMDKSWHMTMPNPKPASWRVCKQRFIFPPTPFGLMILQMSGGSWVT